MNNTLKNMLENISASTQLTPNDPPLLSEADVAGVLMEVQKSEQFMIVDAEVLEGFIRSTHLLTRALISSVHHPPEEYIRWLRLGMHNQLYAYLKTLEDPCTSEGHTEERPAAKFSIHCRVGQDGVVEVKTEETKDDG